MILVEQGQTENHRISFLSDFPFSPTPHTTPTGASKGDFGDAWFVAQDTLAQKTLEAKGAAGKMGKSK
jgi:hypothetical protein